MTSTIKTGGKSAQKGAKRHIARVETACVQDNHILALSVNRRDVDRCVKVIRQYGLLSPPVIGELEGGGQILLSGECEFLALREIGMKSVEAVTIPITGKDEGDKLSLLLSSLKKCPNALSEGILITQLLQTGSYTQSQVGDMLGKSVSWVNKRISLVTRLSPAVKELVSGGQICPHSAQEISRLPAEVQHSFSISAVKEGLPKSSVEALVAAFNAASCPDWMKEQIVLAPRQALARLADIGGAKAIRQQSGNAVDDPDSHCKERFNNLRKHIAGIMKDIYMIADDRGAEMLRELRNDAAALILLIDQKITFSPGKNEGSADSHGN
jgi:ParB family chromosome partitioning protein